MEITHDETRRRFVTETDAGEAELAYEERGGRVLNFTHTFVPQGARGAGVADALAERAFEYARAGDYTVVPTCHFVQGWVRQHPEHSDLLEV